MALAGQAESADNTSRSPNCIKADDWEDSSWCTSLGSMSLGSTSGSSSQDSKRHSLDSWLSETTMSQAELDNASKGQQSQNTESLYDRNQGGASDIDQHVVTQPVTPTGKAEEDFLHVLEEMKHDHDINDLAAEVESLRSSGGFQAWKSQECEKCSVVLRQMDPESSDFWRSVAHGGKPEGCHVKFLDNLLEELKKRFPKDTNILSSKNTNNILSILLKTDLKDVSATVNLEDFARLCMFFGPIKPDASGDCILMSQIHNLAKNSKRRAGKKSSKLISWFAGDMSREESEKRLQGQSDGTFLVRMSSSTENFVVSVIEEGEISHFEIMRDRDMAARSQPYSACLTLSGTMFHSLVELVNCLLDPQSNFLLKERGSLEEEDGIACIRICPNLPYNSIITGYK